MSAKETYTTTIVESPNKKNRLSFNKQFYDQERQRLKQVGDVLKQLETSFQGLAVGDKHDEYEEGGEEYEGHEAAPEGHDIRSLLEFFTQRMERKMDNGFNTLAWSMNQMNGTLANHTEMLEKTEIRQLRLEAQANNREYPLDLWEVPNLRGEFPSEQPQFAGFAPIRSVVQVVNMDNKGKLLNEMLMFYGYQQGKGKHFNANGPIEQRKILLLEELGIDIKHVSRASLQHK